MHLAPAYYMTERQKHRENLLSTYQHQPPPPKKKTQQTKKPKQTGEHPLARSHLGEIPGVAGKEEGASPRCNEDNQREKKIINKEK